MNEFNEKLLVIIPAFNEEASLGRVISSIRENVPQADIVVVNDGSSDSTAAIAERTGVVVLSHIYNLGIGATMQTGYRYAEVKGYDIAVQVDADGQHPADQIGSIIEPIIKRRADMVVGSRFLGTGDYRPSFARSTGMAIFSRIVSAIIKERVTDTTSGFRASGKRCIRYFSYHYPDDYPEVEALVLLHKLGFSIMEVPVRMEERAGGRSSITPVKSVYYMIKVLLAIFVDLLKKAGPER
ncbi:MAG: glycosyltransferase family 2 protein [Deltaproteobacteria bacterium]|nr:glycosyltransferase family 2 protein [Deltaproteobacteria bacterium]